ncbi:hypothetical protein [Lactococcus lactis]|uniref:hypothetical protein n=1 Tax=Lactococcus lactis TaxID=1358 RepID=UPI0021A68331|nr:hypothetical protein [Lactococcus lactis]MCT3132853.1 hypothetical protein [Lactococcus lactis]
MSIGTQKRSNKKVFIIIIILVTSIFSSNLMFQNAYATTVYGNGGVSKLDKTSSGVRWSVREEVSVGYTFRGEITVKYYNKKYRTLYYPVGGYSWGGWITGYVNFPRRSGGTVTLTGQSGDIFGKGARVAPGVKIGF